MIACSAFVGTILFARCRQQRRHRALEGFMIQARGLTKRYGDMFAVDGLDLDVEAGEIFGFLGPNGAGKTTTINMLIGITAPTSGTVTLGGVNVHTDPEKAKAMVGYVPDQPNMYDKLTAWEFLMFVANLCGMDRKRAERRAWQLLEMFELTDRAREQTGGFSHGMKQKTVIAARCCMSRGYCLWTSQRWAWTRAVPGK